MHTNPKYSTLLQFRQNCKECGHQASEHRELTPVDRFIKSEVAKAKRNKCLASLSASEIPLSPIFGQYDLIPLPSDDPSYVSSTVRLYQHNTCGSNCYLTRKIVSSAYARVL